jgi:hypothetical protein
MMSEAVKAFVALGLAGAILAAPVAALARPAATVVQNVAAAELQELERRVDALEADVGKLRARDASQADRIQGELDALRDEVTYLKVKVRKERVSRNEYAELERRVRDVESRIRTKAAPRTVAPHTIPVGQELDVRLRTALSSETAQVEDRFEATTLVDLYVGEELLVPAGSVMGGIVSNVEKATRTDRKGSLTLAFDTLTVHGRKHDIRASVTEMIESSGMKGEAGKIGVGAAAGAIIGGILGGVKGALAGVLIGGGGTILATPGVDVKLEAGTVLRVRFDSPATIQPTE